MKKIILSLLIGFLSSGTMAQPGKKIMPESNFYLQKSKKQKTAAWILLSGGTVMFCSGYVWFVYEGLQGDGIKSGKATAAITMFYMGGAAMLGSIPLFIASARNKGISMNLTAGVKMETTPSERHPSFVKGSYPALAFTLNLH